MVESSYKIITNNLNLFYNQTHILKNINLKIPPNKITTIIGPSGCGKSSFLRCLNRLNDLNLGARIEGKVFLDGKAIYALDFDPVELRRKVGMVFQKPNPFPKSIYENVAYGLKVNGIKDKTKMNEIVERSLKEAALWEEVKDRLKMSALRLSGGQQQRLCIARALAVKPDVLLMDEPCSALDPTGVYKIEELMINLKKNYTIILVTHNMQQAARVSDFTGFLFLGKLIEFDQTSRFFTSPKEKLTENYISGRFV